MSTTTTPPDRGPNAVAELVTARLRLRPPRPGEALEIFETYASDPEVTRYLSWPRHLTVADTEAFLEWSSEEWQRWGVGPYLIRDRSNDRLLGSTGIHYEAPHRAATGYVLARGDWGRGIATEALGAMVELARRLGIQRLEALCHHLHRASARVLEKGGFTLEGKLHRHGEFPNLDPGRGSDVLCYAIVLEDGGEAPGGAGT